MEGRCLVDGKGLSEWFLRVEGMGQIPETGEKLLKRVQNSKIGSLMLFSKLYWKKSIYL